MVTGPGVSAPPTGVGAPGMPVGVETPPTGVALGRKFKSLPGCQHVKTEKGICTSSLQK